LGTRKLGGDQVIETFTYYIKIFELYFWNKLYNQVYILTGLYYSADYWDKEHREPILDRRPYSMSTYLRCEFCHNGWDSFYENIMTGLGKI
jgi:hypothetical protein